MADGKQKVNFSLRVNSYQHLEAMAETRKAYGDLLSDLIDEEWTRRQRGDIHERVTRLERIVEAMAAKLGVGHG